MSNLNTYKSISRSSQTGLSLARNKGVLAVTKPFTPGTIKTFIDETDLDAGESSDKGSPYNSSVSCGSISSQTGGHNFAEDTPNISLGGSISTSPISSPPEDEEAQPECIPEEGYIIVSSGGYYVIKPFFQNISLSTVRYLGSRPETKCIVQTVGNVEYIAINEFKSNCNPSRWSYEDGVRKHSIPEEYNIWCSMPMIDSTLNKITDHFIPIDSVHFSHYGYNFPSCDGSGAKLGGCNVNNDVAFYTKTDLFVSIENVDWVTLDTLTWDYPAYVGPLGSRGLRSIFGFDREQSCGIKVLSESPVERFLNHVNYDRYCLFTVEPVKINEDLCVVCQDYAHKMAQFSFISHNDPFTGESSYDRVDKAEISYEKMTETLALVKNLETPPQLSEDLFAVDSLWQALKNSSAHYSALTSVYYYQLGFGFAYNNVTDTWYGCAIILKSADDEPLAYDQDRILYSEPPSLREERWGELFNVNYPYSGLTALCTAPSISNDLSAIVRPCFQATFKIHGISWDLYDKDYFSYDWKCVGGRARISEGFDDQHPHEYPPDILCLGGFIRPNLPYVYNSFWIQRDTRPNIIGQYHRDIRVDLEGCYYDPRPPAIPDPGNTNYVRTQATLLPDEVEPVLVGSTHGNCRLVINGSVVDETSRFPQGNFLNPWQSIMIGSVFYTVSGYTAITYTMPILLNTTLRKWDDALSKPPTIFKVEELYWWLKVQYWAMILNPQGQVIARWQLTAAPPDYINDTEFYIFKEKSYPSNGTQEYTLQMEGRIEPESVKIYCKVHTQDFYLTEDGLGKLVEEPNQIEDNETILADSSIDYASGVVNFTFGPAFPDEGSIVRITAQVTDVDIDVPIETYQEVVQYKHQEAIIQPYQISYGGVHVLFPNLTVSEDGSVAVFSCRTCGINFTANKRLVYGDKFLLTEGSVFENKYGKNKIQIQMFDLTSIPLTLEPKKLTLPLSLREATGDVLILN